MNLLEVYNVVWVVKAVMYAIRVSIVTMALEIIDSVYLFH